MIKVTFKHCHEIRMGSPYQTCGIELTGKWIPRNVVDLGDWVKVKGYSDDGRHLALAFWDTAGNEPGFHIVVIDIQKRKISISERLGGCCETLRFEGNKLVWAAYPDLRGELDYADA